MHCAWNSARGRFALPCSNPERSTRPSGKKARSVAQGIVKNAPAGGLQLYGTAVEALMSGLGQHGISPDVVARAAAHALTSPHPRTRYRLGAEGPVVGLLSLLPDGLRDRLFLARLPKWG